ncbi:MAG: efflux RND transporter periplasmic adaptor subunit [Alphaproteobacteria bacterium]|nr:efflux RND transporter periplasmic adaptor subunit [Alphaproteobacteria bacterium]
MPVDKPHEPRERLDIHAILGASTSSAPRWMQRRELKWAAAALVVLVLAAVVRWLAGGANDVRYVTEPVTRGDLVVVVTATGSVQPTKQVDISSELSGTVREVLVDYNSAVTAGQVLAKLDTDKLQATVASSRAKLVAAKARVADAEATVVEKQRDLARKRRLIAEQAVSTQDVDQSQAAYDRAIASVAATRADVGVAEADLELNETNLSKAFIRSPINGVVLGRNVDPGQIVASSFQAPVLFSIAEDLKQMELQIDVDEADVGKVRIGQGADFGVDAFPDRRFPATIRDVRFAPETIQGVVTYKAVLIIDNSELLLRPGMTATAEIKVTEIQDALLIPNASLRYAPPVADTGAGRGFLSRLLPGRPPFRRSAPREEAGHDRTVWVLGDAGPTPVRVAIGASDGKRTEVRSGDLESGQALIVDQTVAP